MDNRLQATFMPRQVPGANDTYTRPKGPPNFLMGIALVLILLVGGAWGGLYFYKGQISKANDAKKTQIQDAVNNFDPDLTKQLTVLKARLDAGKSLITGHTAFSRFLDLLSANTVQTIQFSDLSYTYSDDNKIQVDLKGSAHSYNAIAYQSDVFSKVPQIQTPVFSGLELNDKGVITFNVTAKIDPKVVSYADQFKNSSTIPLPVPVEPSTTPATTTRTTSRTTPPPIPAGNNDHSL